MAKHDFINATGAVVGKIENAAGIRYWFNDYEKGAEPAAGDPHYDYIITPEAMPMLAAFGARTLATNTVSSFYEGLPKGAPKGTKRERKADAPESDAVGLEERFAGIVAGDFGATRGGGGGGGVGWNLDDLLQALDDIMQAAGVQINRVKVADALANGGTFKGAALDAKAYRKAVAGVLNVKARYEELRAARQPRVAAEDVASDFE